MEAGLDSVTMDTIDGQPWPLNGLPMGANTPHICPHCERTIKTHNIYRIQGIAVYLIRVYCSCPVSEDSTGAGRVGQPNASDRKPV